MCSWLMHPDGFMVRMVNCFAWRYQKKNAEGRIMGMRRRTITEQGARRHVGGRFVVALLKKRSVLHHPEGGVIIQKMHKGDAW
jgi:hypothetical protein